MTTLADHLPTAARLLPRPGPTAIAPAAESQRVDPAQALSLIHEYGDDLLRMARLITGDVDVARTIVGDVLQAAAACTDPQQSRQPQPSADTRTTLAAAIFRACRAALDQSASTVEPINDAIDWMARISAQQRSAVALYLHGAQQPAQIALLLNLPLRTVCLLLLAAMDELLDPDPSQQRQQRHERPLLVTPKRPTPHGTATAQIPTAAQDTTLQREGHH